MLHLLFPALNLNELSWLNRKSLDLLFIYLFISGCTTDNKKTASSKYLIMGHAKFLCLKSWSELICLLMTVNVPCNLPTVF